MAQPNTSWTVVKRNGEKSTFNNAKIVNAIFKAGAATGEFDLKTAQKLAIKAVSILQQFPQEPPISVETIQDIVEEILLNSTYKKTAKAYIIYRDQHARIRELANTNKISLVDSYLEQLDWQVKENSNMAYSLQGLNNYIANETSRSYWLNKIYPLEIREAHLSGNSHIHDLDQLSVYCVGWDLQDLLLQGFTGVPGKMASLPAKHFRSALGQIVNFFYTLQGEASGAQAFSNFDTLLAPFIRYDKLSYKEVKQALQEFVFNINVPTRVGFQTPFTNVTIDLQPPSNLKEQPVIIGGIAQDIAYGEFQPEMDIFNQTFLEVMSEGDANGRIFTFPIPTYNITKEFDWDNPNLQPLWETTAKYGTPYFANFVNSTLSPDDVRSMCCRLRINHKELNQRGGGLFGANPLTGSIGVVTINMPRLGYLAKNEKDFFEKLAEQMELAKNSLEIKRKTLEKLTEAGLYPYIKFYLRDIYKRNSKYWSNHFSTIGLIGMNEACVNLLGKSIADNEGKEFAVRVLDFMRDQMTKFQEETGNFYNLEATPAEATGYRLAKLDQNKYPDIFENYSLAKDQDEFCYTNSTQLPINYTDDPFLMLELQDELQTKYTGGTVSHIFLGEAQADPNSVKNFIRKVFLKYQLPYLSITPTFSICSTHGYISGIKELCPQCNEPTEIYSRVVGYYRPVTQWNAGKQAEFKLRKFYIMNENK
ncbi:MAG: ribonucleoside triphosphate reductase [Gammaproteobacteria bacterium]|nr:ribonucleoside triphosphate reductase [Gammaproteobacteria bacterium]